MKLFVLLFTLNCTFCNSQEGFVFKEGLKKDKIHFNLVKNLIILPVTLNGLELSFLLDTGVNTSVLLNLDARDSLDLKNVKKIQLIGLGQNQALEAYISENNTMKVGNAISKDLKLFLVYDSSLNFSPKLGVPVHGILGADFFKNLIVKINYPREFIRIYDPKTYHKKLRSYGEVPLLFYRNKPYIETPININGKTISSTFLLDSGLGDALWLFSEENKIPLPKNSFQDFLGFGLIGDVYGKRSKIDALYIKDFEFNEVTAAFPDSNSIKKMRIFNERDGSIGAEILRRFTIIFDYPQRRMFLKRNRFYNDPFHYNMSGIILAHNGYIITETYDRLVTPSRTRNRNGSGKTIRFDAPIYFKNFELRPEYKVVKVRPGSPAGKQGILPDDIIVSINGKMAHRYDLDEITSLFASKDGRKIKLKVIRDGIAMEFEFRLDEMLDSRLSKN